MLNYIIKTSSNSDIIFLIIGGLSIFLFGLGLTKENLKSLASKRLEFFIQNFTNTTLKAFIVGIVATVLIQSSSGVTAIVVSFIASGYLTYRQGLAIMIGANIGTCTTAFLFGINIEDASLIIISIASILCFLSKKSNQKLVWQAILGIGLIFLGLQFMGAGFDYVARSKTFSTLITTYANNFTFSFILGVVLTFVIQSSSAIIGLLEQIYAAGLLDLTPAIAILLGSNIGTTLTGFIATISTNKEAKKAVFANVIFNFLGAILFILVLPLFVYSLNYLEHINVASTPELVIAFSHLIFNVVTAVIAYFLFNYLIKLTDYLYDYKKKTSKKIIPIKG